MQALEFRVGAIGVEIVIGDRNGQIFGILRRLRTDLKYNNGTE